MTQEQINQWEKEHFDEIIRWEKDFEKNTITFVLNTGEKKVFEITK